MLRQVRRNWESFRPSLKGKGAGGSNRGLTKSSGCVPERNDDVPRILIAYRMLRFVRPIPPVGRDKGAEDGINLIFDRFCVSDSRDVREA